MQKNEKKLKLSDIGYYGKPINILTKKELQIAFLDVAQRLYDCAATNKKCNALNIESKGKYLKERRVKKDRRSGGVSLYTGPEKRGVRYQRSGEDRRKRE